MGKFMPIWPQHEADMAREYVADEEWDVVYEVLAFLLVFTCVICAKSHSSYSLVRARRQLSCHNWKTYQGFPSPPSPLLLTWKLTVITHPNGSIAIGFNEYMLFYLPMTHSVTPTLFFPSKRFQLTPCSDLPVPHHGLRNIVLSLSVGLKKCHSTWSTKRGNGSYADGPCIPFPHACKHGLSSLNWKMV